MEFLELGSSGYVTSRLFIVMETIQGGHGGKWLIGRGRLTTRKVLGHVSRSTLRPPSRKSTSVSFWPSKTLLKHSRTDIFGFENRVTCFLFIIHFRFFESWRKFGIFVRIGLIADFADFWKFCEFTDNFAGIFWMAMGWFKFVDWRNWNFELKFNKFRQV